MPNTVGGITVSPDANTSIVVDITFAGHAVTSAYTTANGSVASTLPATITTPTTYHMSVKGIYVVSCKLNGVEIAGDNNNPVAVPVEDGRYFTIVPRVGDAELSSVIGTEGRLSYSADYTTPYDGVEAPLFIDIRTKGTGPVTDRRAAGHLRVGDLPAVNQVNVTAATNATPIVITAAAHGYATGDQITVQGVGGNTAANGIWTITVLSSSTFSLNTSVGNGAYTTGGYVTNRSMMTGLVIEVTSSVARGGLTGAAANGDDANGVTVQNYGSAIATDAYYVADSPAIVTDAWFTAFNHDGKATVGFRAGGTYSIAAAEFNGGVLLGAANGAFGAGDVRLRRSGTTTLALDNGANGGVLLVHSGSSQIKSLSDLVCLQLWRNADSGTNNVLEFCSAAGGIESAVSKFNRFLFTDGSVGDPTYSFLADSNTGMWRSAADTIAFSCGGAIGLRLGPSTMGFFGATPATKPTGVAVTAAGIHAALVTLGLIAA